MTIAIIIFSIALLVGLITWLKVNPFIAFLLVSMLAGLSLGVPLLDLVKTIQNGLGNTLGGLVIIIVLGAMLGKLVAETGAAQQIAGTLIQWFGHKYMAWGLMITGFVIGIPLFYNVGFVLMVPLIFSLSYQFKLNPIVTAIPMMASMSVAHGFLPPHPSPEALIKEFSASSGTTLMYGILVSIPAIILAGPFFAKTFKNPPQKSTGIFETQSIPEAELPGTFASFATAMFPVMWLIFTTFLLFIVSKDHALYPLIKFSSDSPVVMIMAIVLATFVLGLRSGKRSMAQVMGIYTDSVKEVGMILMVIAGAGALKEVFQVSGVSTQIAQYLLGVSISPLILGWMMAAVIRVSIGSATIAGITTAGIFKPMIASMGVDPNLMVLSIGAGSLMFSHVNDSGFWLFKEYFNLTIGETIRTWSVMESIVSIVGLLAVLLLNFFI